MCMCLCLLFDQGNIVALKYINRKRIELTRKVLFELKHVSVSCFYFALLKNYSANPIIIITIDSKTTDYTEKKYFLEVVNKIENAISVFLIKCQALF